MNINNAIDDIIILASHILNDPNVYFKMTVYNKSYIYPFDRLYEMVIFNRYGGHLTYTNLTAEGLYKETIQKLINQIKTDLNKSNEILASLKTIKP